MLVKLLWSDIPRRSLLASFHLTINLSIVVVDVYLGMIPNNIVEEWVNYAKKLIEAGLVRWAIISVQSLIILYDLEVSNLSVRSLDSPMHPCLRHPEILTKAVGRFMTLNLVVKTSMLSLSYQICHAFNINYSGRSITVHKVVLPNSDLQIVLFITYTALLSERWRQIDLACNLISSIIC